jgi:hypothetical protein
LALAQALHRQTPACDSNAGASSTVTHTDPSGCQITRGVRDSAGGGGESPASVSVLGRRAPWLTPLPL